MKDKIVVVGGGEFAHLIIDVIKRLDQFDIIGYTDVTNKGKLHGVNYLGTDDVLENILIANNNCKAVIGVGLIKVSYVRNNIYKKLKKIGFELPSIVSKSAVIQEGVSIGEGTCVLDNALINAETKIGSCCIVGPGAIIEHHCKSDDFVTFATGSIFAAGSIIGENSILSVGAIVVSHKTICKNCFIGAGSVAISDISIEGTYYGVPARKIIS
jgi:UDP-perosamine 4-acetyltransferase